MQRIAEVMTAEPVVVSIDATVSDALGVARRCEVHHLLVVDGSDLVGLVCLCDLAEAETNDLFRHVHTAFLFATPNESVEDAVRLMRDGRVGCLPVIDDAGALLGVVTRRDLRRVGALRGERGVDCCAGCGESHGLAPTVVGSEVLFCRECRARACPPRETLSQTTLGGSE